MNLPRTLSLFFLGLAAGCASARQELKDPNDPAFTISYEVYAPEGKEGKPWVVLLPPTGGVNVLDRFLARKLRDRGSTVLLVHEWTGSTEESLDLGIHDRGLRSAERAFDLLRGRAGGAKLRLVGTSIGGMYAAAMASHRHDGVEKLALVVSGGPLSEVVATSELKAMVELKEKRRKELGFKDDEEYRRILFDRIPNDFVGKRGYGLAAEDILMIIATEDTSVPTATQLKLWEELGKPKRIDIQGSHFRAILQSAFFDSSELADFISRSD